MTAIKNVENLRQHKSWYSLTEEQILASPWSTALVREVKNMSLSYKQIVWLYFMLLKTLAWIDGSILSLGFSHFSHQALPRML